MSSAAGLQPRRIDRLIRRAILPVAAGLFAIGFWTAPMLAQSASVSGIVTDASGGRVASAQVTLTNDNTNILLQSKTNDAGIYSFPFVQPGTYTLAAQSSGFKQYKKTAVTVETAQTLEVDVELEIGDATQTVTVNGSGLQIDTADATVSTVVDRQFAENLPLNGRSFQTLIDLTPGVVVTASNGADSGQFSVNGQRAVSNYWMVDGVSANVGSSAWLGGNQIAGAAGTTSVLGGTNSLVSVDAMQEFRIQTSTFAPEFGRTPGAQISIVTRSGTNQFHGSLFEYLRNDALDANNWFNTAQSPPLPKAEERQNDFGGTLGGPIWKDKTFFFFSYEGLRLRLPMTQLTYVPDAEARANASAVVQPYLNAFPLDPTQPDLGNGIAEFNASYSNPASLDAYSVRIDHRVNDKVSLFGRYNYSPSDASERGLGEALSDVTLLKTTVQTGTVGVTWTISTHVVNEFRFNYSSTNSGSSSYLDSFGGATPLQTLPLPSPYTVQNADFSADVFSLGTNGSLDIGPVVRNVQRQFNVVDSVSVQKGSHALKFGFDYRRLSPQSTPFQYGQSVSFNDVPSFESGDLASSYVNVWVPNTFLFRNVSAFAQDTWQISRRVTLTYGLRWDTDFAPSTLAGPNITGLTGFNLSDLSQLALAPPGTPPFKTTYGNFAPRVGAAYQLRNSQNFATVARGGFGVFYDLATSETANLIVDGIYPFSSNEGNVGGTFPLTPDQAAPPPILPPSATSGVLGGFDPNLKLPYTLQWNVSVEQALGTHQSVSASYIGAVGRRLLQSAYVYSPNSDINQAVLTANTGTSDYDALQLQFNRSLSAGLQALASYTWSHCIDTASAGSDYVGTNAIESGGSQNENRGDCDFDIRHAFSAGVTYAIPSLRSGSFLRTVTDGWSLDSIITAHSAPPVTVYDGNFYQLTDGFFSDVRPDVMPGIPLYLYGPQYPGGKAINNTPGATTCPDGSPSIGPFCAPPTDANGNPTRQGDLGRNTLRGFGFAQVDLGVHRDFPLHEAIKLQFRAEMFNVFNHPNFAPPDGNLADPTFGQSTELLGQYLNGGLQGGAGLQGSGGLSQLYQIGAPRSIQFALKLLF